MLDAKSRMPKQKTKFSALKKKCYWLYSTQISADLLIIHFEQHSWQV
jgi:hypothetical protein